MPRRQTASGVSLSGLNQGKEENLLDMYPLSGHSAVCDEAGLIRIEVPKFRNVLGKALCALLRLSGTYVVKLDEIGSFIYQRCDGKTSVRRIIAESENHFGERIDPCIQRVSKFITSLERNGLISIKPGQEAR